MPPTGESLADWVAGGAARTVAAGSARLSAAIGRSSPVPGPQDMLGSGVADLAARRARLTLVPVPGRTAAQLSWLGEGSDVLGTLTHPRETLYDGGRAYLQVAGRWTSFSRTDPAGARSMNDPLWPLDAMAGANGDAVEVGADLVQDTPVTRCRLRALGRLPALGRLSTSPRRGLTGSCRPGTPTGPSPALKA